ncbi:peptidoglycan-binding domain-containing protein [Nonomuraea sp. NPDC050202]|uniref:peptidoglycan-binding domain-containing protein n=1 Tax=Nonomuraea sp. NPDC050202 TaxID=3155035 RepID=UPI00340A6EEA
MLDDLARLFAWLAAALVRPASGLYGEFDLRPGDRDPAPGLPARYGGADRPELTGTTHVRDLHRDLRELGFLLAPPDAAAFTTATWRAVMEFQRYASLPDSATEREPRSATLLDAVAADTHLLHVSAASAFPAAGPFRVLVEEEVVEVTAVSTVRLTTAGGARGPGAALRVTRGMEGTAAALRVTRGMEGTAAAAHARGAGVELVRWSDRLVAVHAPFYERYADPITGVVNAWTRFVLRRWKERRRRCPVVVEAWELRDGRPDRLHTLPASGHRAGNVWGAREITSTGPRLYVRDLTRTWERPSRPPVVPTHPELDVTGDYRVLGDYAGPRAWPEFEHTWRPEGEMLPEHLLPAREPGGSGPTLRQLVEAGDRAVLGTYKVVRAVSEVEAIGYFDCLNAYDRAFVSLGPCHWTAGLASGPSPGSAVDEGELWGFVAYLKATNRYAFAQAFGRFGVDVATEWGRNGAELFNPSQRKYTGRPTVPREGGGAHELGRVEEFDLFRDWHWFYRVQMAGRTVDGFRRAMWDMARLRIRDVGETPWDGPAGPPTWTVPGPQGPRPARIKDVITSERGMAIVHRWHIRAPANMVSAGPATEPPEARRIGRAGPVLRAACEAAAKEHPSLFAGPPGTWGDAAELALVAHLRAQGGASVEYVHEWPRQASRNRGFTLPYELLPDHGDGRRLDPARDSFLLDAGGLPPEP